MSSEDMRRIFVECLNRAMQATLGTSFSNPAHVEPKNFLREGLPLVGKDGLTLQWKDGKTEPFFYKYHESDSEYWSQAFTARIHDRNQQPFHEITVIVPMYLQDDGKTFNEAYTNQVRNSVVRSVYELPLLHIDALRKIEVHVSPNKWDEYWQKKYNMKNPSSGAAGDGIISIFPRGLEFLLASDDRGMVRHEFGHLLAQKLFHSSVPPEEYIQLTKRDEYSPSPYALNSPNEDFAEAVRLYLQTDAGRLNPEWRDWLKNRFEYLDKCFTNDPNLKKYALYSLAVAAVSSGMFSKEAQAHQTQDGNVWINDGHGHLILLQPSVPQASNTKLPPLRSPSNNAHSRR
jgi:hypothetical protein